MEKKLISEAFSNSERNTVIESIKNVISKNDEGALTLHLKELMKWNV